MLKCLRRSGSQSRQSKLTERIAARSDYLRWIGNEDLRRDLIARSWHLNLFSEALHISGFKVRRFWKFVEV